MGPKKQGFCSKINCIQMKLLYFVNWHSDRASKSAKIILSKSIFYIKKKESPKNINLGDPFLLKTFFSRLNFWTTLLSKIRPNFCRPHTMSIHKILQFHLTTVDFWAETWLLRTHQSRNSMTLLTLIVTRTEDGSTDVVPQILYDPYLILGVFGSCMF